MQINKKTVRYDLSITDKEIKVLIDCIKGCEFSESDCRDQSLALDLLNEFSELFDNKDYEAEMIDSVMRKPSEESILRAKARIDKAQILLRKLRGN